MNRSSPSLLSRILLAVSARRVPSAPRAPKKTSLLADTLGAAAAGVSVCALAGAVLAALI